MNSIKIRNMWLDFFKSKNHLVIEPSSLIPKNDDSLLWINSGVATLKPYFDGRETPKSNRMTGSQPSIRTNDITNVGVTARHHTLFEMLGNFSIGDYFKKEAIMWAWEFLTSEKWLNLNPDKLFITVFMEDKETISIWKNIIKIKEEHLILGTKDTNFWEIGAGPCGPNTEIFYDRGVDYDLNNQGIKLLQEDLENDRYIEIWNIVFSQFNNNGNGKYSELPRKNIDTGAGLERIASVMQNTHTNFETDLFLPIIKEIERFTSYKYDVNNYFAKEKDVIFISKCFRIIADHLRAVSVAIGDGAFPDNKERGYVIRKLIRRAVVNGHYLKIDKPFLHKLVNIVLKVLGPSFVNLNNNKAMVVKTIKEEEVKFQKTLSTGMEKLTAIIKKDKYISDKNAFLLFESYGFPIDITIDIAKNNNIKIDVKGFENLLAQSKIIAKNARADKKAINFQSKAFIEDKTKTTFIGYDTLEHRAKIKTIIFEDEILKKISLNDSQTAIVVFEKTPFYAEKGGQLHDIGKIISKDKKKEFDVINVQEGPNKQYFHEISGLGKLSVGDVYDLSVDENNRLLTMKNHSGTHIIHSALRAVLGEHVLQTGSYNDANKLRIDVNHNQPIVKTDIISINTLCRSKIKENIKGEYFYCSYDDAVKKHNAIAIFGEKYDTSNVRVVKFGNFSCELCGGTHVVSTKDIEDLIITNVESKGSTTFRITALTSSKTIASYVEQQVTSLQNEVKEQMNFYNANKSIVHDKDLEDIIEKILKIKTFDYYFEINDYRTEFQNMYKNWTKVLQKKQIDLFISKNIKTYKKLDIIKENEEIIYFKFEDKNININMLKMLAENSVKNNLGTISLCFNVDENTIQYSIASTSKVIFANNISKQLNKQFEAKGGGSPTLSQGSISSNNFELFENYIKELLKNG